MLVQILYLCSKPFVLSFSINKDGIFEKLITSEFWATVEWAFVIPMQRIGYRFLNPAQLSLSSYAWNFIAQLWSNKYWLKLPTTVDDYTGMALILFGMYVAKFSVFG